jgi:hypothetical protein
MRKYYADQEPADCLWCGEPLPTIRHWRTLFCGRKCSNAYFNNLTAEARAEERADLKCVVCGEALHAKRKDVLYCSRKCARVAFYRKAAE